MIVPLHSSLGDRAKPCMKKRKEKQKIISVNKVGGWNVKWCSCYTKQFGHSSKNYKWNYHLIQQSHFWTYCQQNWKQDFYKIFALPQLGMVTHSCDPNTLGVWGRRITWAQESKTRLGKKVRPLLYKAKKKKKISQSWWHILMAPATQEAEWGELLESRRLRLQ